MFVEPDHAASSDYKAFWNQLRNGDAFEAQIRRLAKGGRPIWLQAVYTPIRNRSDKITKVIKFASDITAHMQVMADYEGQIKAIHKSQAVIEFDLSGNIITANENFLKVTGLHAGRDQGKASSHFRSRERTDQRSLRPLLECARGW